LFISEAQTPIVHFNGLCPLAAMTKSLGYAEIRRAKIKSSKDLAIWHANDAPRSSAP
jgi:hypothetical protein